ncbi:MAG: hypothetical protein UU77_C0037G0008 [candidate division WWE3 bacterium GW2011_GWC1_41_7]|uniref:Uncharacterized protein n=4 Tax=Katanobacteria TaxID=422282 RepID=A0A0G0X4C4_UNCKA|nr:MAG: hypothetical protein UU77_C0037G0008 [candidate division WWE3 bacterium GW2011_GWC1_41_7]KKS22710.1 MAG: hypothetical protein UU80_C0003G0010 [candidate division WWE3 bacterium GW2011_GWA1_41_8]OGC57731.1 MAG: hypothetical protein A2976_02215 [candidate division WWE3 bacterium RIFCSPLOWO2_01_FULL_41_9]
MISLNRKVNKRTAGFTMVELILYVATLALLLSSIFSVYQLYLRSQIKNNVIQEVEQQGAQVMQVLTQTIRNSENVNSPNAENSSDTLSLNVVDTAKDPTVISVSDGTIYIKEGTEAPVALTSPKINAGSVMFSNLSTGSEYSVITITYTLNFNSNSDRNEYNFERNFYGSAGLRH